MASGPEISCFIACPQCITEIPNTQSAYEVSSSNGHSCAQTVLLAREAGTEKWFRVRDRTYQASVTASLSTSATATPPRHCLYNDMICPFAHSAIEQRMWQLETNGKQSVFEIITSRRELGLSIFDNIGSYFMWKFGGWFRCICRQCLSECAEGGNTCCGPEGHEWNQNKMLTHFSLWESFSFNIFESSSHFGNEMHQPVLCELLDECPDRQICVKCHSFIERDFASLRQLCTAMTIEEVCEKLNDLKITVVHRLAYEASLLRQKSPDFRLAVMCKGCHQLGLHECRNNNTSEACSRGHSWQINAYAAVLDMSTGKWIPVKPLPRKLPKDASRLDICRDVAKKGSCSRMAEFQFAHSRLEKDVWAWQMTSQPPVLNLVEYIEEEQKSRHAESIERRIAAGVSDVHRPSVVLPPAHYCRYCNKQCNSVSQYAEHCRSKDHIFKVTADQEHEWKFRIPPAGGHFDLCLDNEEGHCEYSSFASEYNQCVKAHGSDELEEWHQRVRYRQEKLKISRQHNAADSTYQNVTEFCSEVPGAEVTCDQSLAVHLTEKTASYTWNFHVKTQGALKLHRVALQFCPSSVHFGLTLADRRDLPHENCQLLDESNFSEGSNHDVAMTFQAHMFGSFRQLVIFDFGQGLLLQKKLVVDVGNLERYKKIEAERMQMQMQLRRWTDRNAVTVYCSPSSDGVAKYEIPDTDELADLNCEENVPLTEGNYVQQMHRMLYLEELTRMELVSRFNVRCPLAIRRTLSDPSFGMKIAQGGTLFGEVTLQEFLNDDTDGGHLILSSCSSVLFTRSEVLTAADTDRPRVYEAEILSGVKQKDVVYISLHETSVEELGLSDGKTADVEIQFQLNRSNFVQMHEAVDAIRTSNNLHLLFPIRPASGQPGGKYLNCGIELNDRQKKVIDHVLEKRPLGAVPFIVYGPFGTGKTLTLAEAAKAAVLHAPKDARVLICTHSNSAADLYITKHFHPHNENAKLSVMRIYYEERLTGTVSDEVKLYCRMSSDRSRFVLPSSDEVLGFQIVVTTLSMSAHLVRLGLRGKFTHILLDEAGQALECEAIMPLALAVPPTCVVLSGDHKQISPAVYCQKAKQQKFHVPLLERLFLYYKKLNLLGCNTVLLYKNYRSCEEIVNFLSTTFYRQKECLVASRGQKPVGSDKHKNHKALGFYCTEGSEEEIEGCSYFNMSEVEEIVQVVVKFSANIQQQDICVVSYYSSQISRIRSELRKKKLAAVTVESVHNCQGKEFRALLISTVRTMKGVVDNDTNLGFLSDPKLMNTAISRAVDCVAVVGDPVAMCTIGSCRKFWLDYIKVCSQQGGLYPPTVTMDWIHLQLQEINVNTHQRESDDISPDEILEELAKQAAGIPSSLTAGPVPFTIEADEGYGVLTVAERSSNDGARCVKESEADEVCSDREALLRLIREQPDKYVHCKLNIVSHDNIHADFVDKPVRQDMAKKGIQHLVIEGRENCEHALSGDEIVVELLKCDSSGATGKVSGVLRECISRKNLTVVCVADSNTCKSGIVRPLDDSLPCFQTLTDKQNIGYVKRQSLISIYSFRGLRPEFCRFAKINPDQPNNMLFRVRFLKWKRDSPIPLGVVIDEIPLGYDFDSAVKILAINCQLHLHFPAKALAEVDVAVRHHSVADFCRNFTDFTDIRIFTIDNEKAEDLDDAISLVMLDDETCRVGIHIVDVTYFVQKDSCIDNEAFERLETFYRDDFDDPLIPMLPHRLSTDLCSLLPDCPRPAVSFWYKVKLSTGKIVESSVSRSLVKSCRKFSYQEVNNVLNSKSESGFDEELSQLFNVARAWSKQRGSRCHTANHMITELMVKVKETAASLVVDKFSDCVPLYMNQTNQTLAPMEQIRSYATAKVVPDFFSRVDPEKSFLLLKPVWWKIMEQVVAGKFTEVKELLLDADKHGQEFWRQLDWSDDESQKVYRCSGSVNDDTSEKMYMRVTSPMRRYMDLVSLRIVVAAIEGQADSPYTRDEMENLCKHANDGLLLKNKYEHEIRVLRRAVELKSRAAVMFPYVSSFTESSLSLRFPSVTSRRPELQNLKYSGLDLVQNPVVQTSVTFNWQQRIYDLQHRNAVRSAAREVQLLNGNDKYCFILPIDVWKSIIEKAQFCNVQEVDHTLKTVHNEHIRPQMIQTDSHKDMVVTAEMFNNPDEDFREHFVRMSLGVRTGSLTQVQLTADDKSGMLQPTIQLFCLTPKLDICVEHRLEPLKCFSSEFAEPASQKSYQSVEKYQQAWLPVVSMEAANSAVEEGGASICGARIKWWKADGQIRGRIQLEKEYCKHRQVSFYPMNARYFQEDYKLLPEEKKPRIIRGPNEFDYLCIRYTGSMTDECQDMFSGKFPVDEPQHRTCGDSNRRKTYAEVVKMPAPKGAYPHRCKPVPRRLSTLKSPSWVGHGITTYVSKFSRKNKPPQKGSTKMINVHFRLHQHSSDFPTILLSKGLYIDCTIEWLPKLTPQHRVEDAIIGLKNEACGLVQNLALGKMLPDAGPFGDETDVSVPNFEPPNSDQERATRAALDGTFTMIQGPPGTGKSKTGARIAYLLATKHHNKVLCCGPTNTAVDTVAKNLLAASSCSVRLLRVYGEEIEHQEYPLPWAPKPPRRSKQQYSVAELKSRPELAYIALHHRIRESSNPHSSQIKGLDYKFRSNPDSVSEDDIQRFLKALTTAELYELQRADIILCTCSTAGAPRLTRKFSRTWLDDSNLRERAPEQRYTYVKFASHHTRLFTNQAEILFHLENVLYTKESSEQAMHDLVSRCGFETCSLLEDENCLLDAVVYQLNQLRKVTDSDELRQEAVNYLEQCPSLTDGKPLQHFVNDETWSEYLQEMRDNHYCDHLMLVSLATVLRRIIILHSGAEPEPIHIIPDNVNERFRPIHVGHMSHLTFVTLRLKSGVQPQDDDVVVPFDEDDSIIQEDEVEDDDATDTESPSAVQFPRTPAGETSRWNIIVDESAMCTEPETLIPLVGFSPNVSRIILIGDHMQLQPIIKCTAAKKARLDKSLFQRYAERDDVDVIMLTEQYRMHKTICDFPSKQFYGGRLRCAVNCHKYQLEKSELPANTWPGGLENPVVFCNVVGTETTQPVMTDDASEQSKSNVVEAEHAVKILSVLVKKFGVRQDQVVILTQYRAQQKKITELLTANEFSNKNVSTVVLSQGREWEYVILSCVRSLAASDVLKRPSQGWLRYHLGIVSDRNQINVAITRAKKGLIILGNQHLLECDDTWQRLITSYKQKKAAVYINKFLDRINSVK